MLKDEAAKTVAPQGVPGAGPSKPDETTATTAPTVSALQSTDDKSELHVLQRRYSMLVNLVIPLGATLAAERCFGDMLERILTETRKLCNADGGTLYLLDDRQLEFAIVQNASLGIAYGGESGPKPPFTPLPLVDPQTGQPNHRHIAVHVALTGDSANISDAYASEAFDFTGTRKFDEKTGYRSRSILAAPLKDPQGQVIGVIQVINAHDWSTGCVIAFDTELQRAVESLALLAASALVNYQREQALQEKIQSLSIQIDQANRAREVSQIAGTDYFQNLAAKAQELRRRYNSDSPAS